METHFASRSVVDPSHHRVHFAVQRHLQRVTCPIRRSNRHCPLKGNGALERPSQLAIAVAYVGRRQSHVNQMPLHAPAMVEAGIRAIRSWQTTPQAQRAPLPRPPHTAVAHGWLSETVARRPSRMQSVGRAAYDQSTQGL
eukprot:581510-Rhodomonas_salina.1